ncbi:MAG TPA: HNH endonuclease signature motif containing protein [Naasia sp.]|jgi:biotin operon repressor
MVLIEIGLAPAQPATDLLRLLATDAAALHDLIRGLAELSPPDESVLPNVDRLVDEHMRRAFPNCIDQSLVRKSRKTGRQNRRLLAYLMAHVGEEVSLQELLLVNGLHNGTSRRLRELETEHGHFRVTVEGKGDKTTYRLESVDPDIPATAYYWLKKNIRDRKKGTITPHNRLLALLSARLGEVVPLDDLAYVLPKNESRGRGIPRTPQLAVARRIRELREEGWQVQSGKDKTRVGLATSDYILETLDRLPAYERIKAKVRDAVLLGAGKRCENCGWGPADGSQRGKKQLEVHHRDPQRARPEDVNDPKNLEVLCNVCHAGVESRLKRAAG